MHPLGVKCAIWSYCNWYCTTFWREIKNNNYNQIFTDLAKANNENDKIINFGIYITSILDIYLPQLHLFGFKALSTRKKKNKTNQTKWRKRQQQQTNHSNFKCNTNGTQTHPATNAQHLGDHDSC